MGGLILPKSISVEKNGFVAGTKFIFCENKNGARSRIRFFSRMLFYVLSRIFLILRGGSLDNFSLRDRFSGVQKNYPCRVEITVLPETL